MRTNSFLTLGKLTIDKLHVFHSSSRNCCHCNLDWRYLYESIASWVDIISVRSWFHSFTLSIFQIWKCFLVSNICAIWGKKYLKAEHQKIMFRREGKVEVVYRFLRTSSFINIFRNLSTFLTKILNMIRECWAIEYFWQSDWANPW